jgi:hypothetical protein
MMELRQALLASMSRTLHVAQQLAAAQILPQNMLVTALVASLYRTLCIMQQVAAAQIRPRNMLVTAVVASMPRTLHMPSKLQVTKHGTRLQLEQLQNNKPVHAQTNFESHTLTALAAGLPAVALLSPSNPAAQ